MFHFQLINIAVITAFASLCAACGGAGGGGTDTVAMANTSGQVVNSYISGATVTLDMNDDGICDTSEPTTTTDASGRYSFAGKGEHLVCATGGTNTVTGLPFVGRLLAPARATVVTPITTLIVKQVFSSLPAPTTGKAAPLDPASVAAAQTKIMAQLSLPSATPVLTTDPVALMTKPGATSADAKLEQTNAAVQVLLQLLAQSLVESANLPITATANTTNEAFEASADGLQTALTAVSGGPVDLTTATSATTGRLINAMAMKAAATTKASKTLAAVSASFASLSPTSFAAAMSSSPLPDLVNAVAASNLSSLTTKGGAEAVALSANQIGTVMRQAASLITDSADSGSVAQLALTNLMKTLLPTTGAAVTQAAANTAIADAIAKMNGAMPTGKPALTAPNIVAQPPVVIPKKG